MKINNSNKYNNRQILIRKSKTKFIKWSLLNVKSAGVWLYHVLPCSKFTIDVRILIKTGKWKLIEVVATIFIGHAVFFSAIIQVNFSH